MESAYFRELKRYDRKSIAEALHISLEDSVEPLRKLKTYGIVKIVKATQQEKNLTELTNEEVEISDIDVNSIDVLYVFDFVGVVIVGKYGI